MAKSEKQHKRNSLPALITAMILAAAAVTFAVTEIKTASEGEDSAAALREAVRSRAMQCYVIEGAYPESLDYLTEKYGLAVNSEDYQVIYIAYAQNIPPEIKVVPKKKDKGK